MSQGKENKFIAWIMVFGMMATVAVAAVATDGATGYSPDPHAWFFAFIVPVFLLLSVTSYSYYGDKESY
jgi:hypothetical protein